MTHMKTQPGLHAHSFSPTDNLMGQFVVERRGFGWLALASFGILKDAQEDALDRTDADHQFYRVIDQFDDNRVLYTMHNPK